MFWENYIVNDVDEGNFKLVYNGQASTIIVEKSDFVSVLRAVKDLQKDIYKVSTIEPKVVNDWIPESRVVIVGTIGKSKNIDQLIDEGKVDTTQVRGKW